MMEILALGNEFIEEDSFAKKVCSEIKDFKIINIKDSFELMEILQKEEHVVIIDVVKNLEDVSKIDVEDLESGSFLSAHDFDAGFLIKLLNNKVDIIGLPEQGNVEEVREKLRMFLQTPNS